MYLVVCLKSVSNYSPGLWLNVASLAMKSVLKHCSHSQLRAPGSCRLSFGHAMTFHSPDRTRQPVCRVALWVCQKLMTLLGADCRGRW